MQRTRFLSLLTGFACLLASIPGICAAEVDCDAVYCFTQEDFQGEEPLAGICITGLPQAEQGAVLLGQRILRPGDILTAEQLTQMTFSPLRTQTDQEAAVSYLPIYADSVAPSAVMTISIRGKADKAPAAEDFAAETYKNIPLEGQLKVKDPEQQPMAYTVVRQPRRGTVTIAPDGSFTYTPKKNKVGVDSFTYTAVDPAGNTSREATVTITILKPSDATQYSDTTGHSCRFAAEWMKNTGIFTGENLAGSACFQPDKTVTQGEFLTMLMKTLEIPAAEEEIQESGAPAWLQPYLTAALRAGITAGLPTAETFGSPITGAEAAVMLQNALDLAVTTGAVEESAGEAHWAESSLAALAENGIQLDADSPLTRGQAAQTLYRASQLAPEAPGMAVFRRQG